jgi:outer membrane protein TolC
MRAEIGLRSARGPRLLGARALWLACLAASAACAGPGHDRYETFAEDWMRSEPPAPAAPDDTLFDGANTLQRAELVRRVLERNPSIRAARFAWRAALERHPQVTSLDDPMLGAGLAPLSIGSSEVDTATRFELSQKLPFPGKRRLRGEAALGEAEAAAHDFAAVRLRLAMLASLAFDDWVLAARSRAINADHVALLEDLQHTAAARYAAGEGTQQDPLRAEVELAHAIHRDAVLAADQRVAAAQINALLHRAPDAPLPPPPASGTEPAAEAAPAEAASLEAFPELRAAQARVAAREAEVALARREWFPDVTLVGAHDRLMQERQLQPFVGVELEVPLQLGRRRAALREAEAELEQARSERDALADEVGFSVVGGAARLEEAKHVLHVQRDRLLPAARDRVDAARAGFEAGRTDFADLIEAQRDLLDVQLGVEESQVALARRRAEFDRARGQLPGLEW